MKYELKSCTFCGGRAAMKKSHRAFIDGMSTRVTLVRCKKCGARSNRFKLEDYGHTSYSRIAEKKAADAWNERSINENTLYRH